MTKMRVIVIPAEAGIQVLLRQALDFLFRPMPKVFEYLSISRKFLLVRLGCKEAACVIDDAVNARNRGERNFVQRLNLDWPVAVHKPKAGKNVVNVVNPVRGNYNTVALSLNAARCIADDEPNRRRAIGQIDDSER